MSFCERRLVLVHGLWDAPQIFRRLVTYLNRENMSVFIPCLPHKGGRVPLTTLACDLDNQISARFGVDTDIELFGFSMGGVISRVWLQQIGGALRTRRFISVGTPHRGSFLAQLVPSLLFAGIADMKRGSHLLHQLNNDSDVLKDVQCSSYFCRWDLLVIPGWEATLPIGSVYPIPVLTHKQLISDPKSLRILANAILKD